MLSAFCVDRFLPQKFFALGKLSIKLIVKVVAVGKDNDRGTIQGILQQMSIEDHRQRFSAALCVPENTALAVRYSCVLCRFDCFSYCKILMVSGKNFEALDSLVGEADKVFDYIQQTIFLEQSFKEGVKLCILGIFITAIFRFPLHKTIFT